MPKPLVCTPSGVSQETALSWETTTDTQHQTQQAMCKVLFSRLTNHRLIYLRSLPFYDSFAALLIEKVIRVSLWLLHFITPL